MNESDADRGCVYSDVSRVAVMIFRSARGSSAEPRKAGAMLLFLSSALLAAPPLPTIPDQFDTWITCNIVNKKYTTVVHEIYDRPNNIALMSRWHGDHGAKHHGGPNNTERHDPDHGLVKTLYLFDQGEYFHVNSSGCYGDKMDNIRFGPFAHAHRAPTTKELFDFAKDGQEENYVGQESINGVLCDKWRSVQTFGNFSMTLEYYFSAQEWAVPESNSTRVPVLLYLLGSRPSHAGDGSTHDFEHYYSFGHFRVRPISPAVEAQFYSAGPASPLCTGNITSQPSWGMAASQEREEFCYEHCGDKVNVGPIHGGVAFGYVVLGAVVTVLVMVIGSFCLGRCYGRRFQPMVSQKDVRLEMGMPSVDVASSASSS